MVAVESVTALSVGGIAKPLQIPGHFFVRLLANDPVGRDPGGMHRLEAGSRMSQMRLFPSFEEWIKNLGAKKI